MSGYDFVESQVLLSNLTSAVRFPPSRFYFDTSLGTAAKVGRTYLDHMVSIVEQDIYQDIVLFWSLVDNRSRPAWK